MPRHRDRYVTVCQQLLVTGAVLAVGLSSAGVLTLQIVAPEHSVGNTHTAAHPGPDAPVAAEAGAGLGAGIGAGVGAGAQLSDSSSAR